jgi:16S rRNA (uracil1498-N3)-methyltransferase
MTYPDLPFFVSSNVCDAEIILTEAESFHAAKVLRLYSGDKINVTDGNGNYALAEITKLDARNCVAVPLSLHTGVAKHNYNLHLAISPLRNMDRLEWMIEKAVEMGIDCISLVACARTVKKNVNITRLQNIVISACKQSKKVSFPKINPLVTYNSFLESVTGNTKVIAHCISNVPRQSYRSYIDKHDDVTILIGPEGDFSNSEIEKAISYGFDGVHFGGSRLRTETAGLLACSMLYARYEV